MTEREVLLEETVRELDLRCVGLTQRNLTLIARVAQLERALRTAATALIGALEPEATTETVGAGGPAGTADVVDAL